MKELEKNDNVTLYDYYNYKLPDEYFGDGNHLNRTGASVFTPMIMNRINSN
jgi:lysophospholipase L1-like esterase